ncbi:protein mono-ADP-ribosyltransferase PARP14-like isoform X2 [Melanerpes formicivorus]|uniref:protein mono-ADP-ribosyltransferase PARP14-like isoform X2 n=1 Tax=Melanerpes formicivorus TaxID=211600 RepID=UPI00358F8053
MAGKRPRGFPLLVRGDWGPAGPTVALKKKLLCYFQSQKRSGGGECELRAATGTGHLHVFFARSDVKQRVLERSCHKLCLGEKGELKLIVTDPETAAAAEEEKALDEKLVPTKVVGAMSNLQTKDKAEALEEAKSFVPKSELQEEAGSLENIAEKSAVTSASVVFENTGGCSPECLNMLIENISGLALDDGFAMEVIPERNVAVATFTKSIDTTQFVNKCLQNKRLKEFQVTARLLELTRSIKAEEVPASVSTDYITVYFENARNGGGPVADVQLFPKEKAAIITFCDHKDLKSVLEKQHLLDQTEISVHPYYHSLGEALYGAARPTMKMPDPFGVPLDPYVWQFLQRQAALIQDINQEMAVCHCELKWPQADCERPEITLCPSSSLSKQKKSATKLIKTWKQNASTEFSRIMARYIAIKCKVNSVNWEDVRNRLAKDVALIITDVSEETVVIAGNRAAVDSAEKEMRDCMEKATRESEREKPNLEVSMFVTPGKYAVLHNAGLEDNIHEEYPYLKIFYDDVNKTVHLRGLLAEVYKVKADLLEKLLNIPCTPVTIDPHVLYYLQRVDSKTVSETLFTKKNINAFYELEDDSVLLFGDAPEDLSEAERQIKTSLEYKCISMEDGEVTKKEQWRSLLASLGKEYSSSEESVVIDEPAGKENEVVIAGFSKAVTEVYQKLTDFIDRNTHVEEVVPAKSVVVVQYVEEEKSNICLELRKKGVSVCFETKKPSISLSGPKAEVSKAVTTFKEILSSLYSRDVPIDKPGAKEFFTERKDSWIFEAKQRFSCLIRLEEEEEQNQENDEKVVDNRKLFYKEMLPDGVVVAVYKGNLCNYPADVVVNPANEDLQHTGGLADALFKAAGPELQRDCDELLRKNGSLHPGCAVITRAGKLPCKNIIHAIGPRWRQDEAEQCVCLLKKAVKKSLQLAGIYDHHSIALPAISGAIFGFPLQTYGDSVVSSIQETLEKSVGDSSLKEVDLVSDEEEMVRVLSETVRQVFAGESSSQTLPMKESQKEKRKDLQMITTDEGLCIRVEEKYIQEATTDVIVNSVGEDLKFGVGPLCKALLEKAGPELKEEFDEEAESPSTFEESVLCTSGYDLACKFVLHAILPAWDGEIGQNTKTLEDIIMTCLKETENRGLKTIAFPAIGTGGFGFPKAVVSKLMFDAVFKFSSSRTLKTLQEVHFLLDPKDVDNIQVFTSELESRIAGSQNAEGPQSSFIRPVSTEALGVHEMQIGSITLQVISGDITKEDTEVIVSVSNSAFDATSGVFKAIVDAAGSDVEDECYQYAHCAEKSGFITTQSGNLLCSKIIHLVHNCDVKSQVSKVLNECELRKYQSVAFPAIGTGQAGQSPSKVADDMLDAIVEFASKRSVQHLKKIKIVIFQTNMLRDFYESMKKREGSDVSTKESWMSLFKSFLLGKSQDTKKKKDVVLEKKVDLATFQICGESQENVDAAEAWIENLILKEQFENTISDDLIANFDDSEIDILADLQRRKHVTIQLENHLSPPCIKISGISRDVYFVSVEVQKMVKKIKDTEEERSKAELVHNLVEWRYSASNGTFVALDKLTNMQLEDAKLAKEKHLTVKINQKKYRVDLKTLQAKDQKGKTVIFQRVQKNEAQQSVELPEHWNDMQNEWVKVVNLQPSHQEYLVVQKKFKRTCPNYSIKKIERIQNPFLWQTYQIKKISLCKKNSNQNNEKLLFHGTPSSSLSMINYNGFNRGFAGKNGASIGNGTYFAVDASYSAQETWSTPDVDGKRYMYLARVLTGKYCQGSKGLITPPPKHSSDPTDLYDSVVDCVNFPTMFVIFNDIQAYPEYLITFKKV